MESAYILWGSDQLQLENVAAELWGGETPKLTVLTGDARPELEELPQKWAQEDLELARIIAVVDARELEKRRELKSWWEMLTHFADVMLITHTKEVGPAWLTALEKTLKDRPMEIYHWPECLKKNKDSTLVAITFPEARRLSQYFEQLPDDAAPVFEAAEEDPEDAEEMPADEAPEAEKYFERDAAGRYKVKVTAP